MIRRFLIGATALSAIAAYGNDLAPGEKYANLPLNKIRPAGWHLQLLQRQKAGLTGHVAESGFPYDTPMWLGKINLSERRTRKDGAGWFAYEQVAYYLDGALRTGLLLRDDELQEFPLANLNSLLDNPEKSGQIGVNVKDLDWPRVVLFRMFMAQYEATKDKRILDALTRHYLVGKPKINGGRCSYNAEIIFWLYRQTGNKELLKLAESVIKKVSLVPYLEDKKPHGHGVSLTESAKLPILLYLYSGDKKYLNATLKQIDKIYKYHGLAHGLYSCNEHVAGKKAGGLHETCNMTDMLWTLGYVFKATGDVKYADLMEKIFFNPGLGAITKDFKAFQYYSAPNMISTQKIKGKHVGRNWIKKCQDPVRVHYLPQHDTECCAGNIHRMAPSFIGRMWMKTKDNGIAAVLYGPGSIAGKIDNVNVTIDAKTEYPFEDQVSFSFITEKAVKFPFKLRIPNWSKSACVSVNGKKITCAAKPGTMFTVNRTFNTGDTVRIKFNNEFMLNKGGEKNQGIALSRGPLMYSLLIKPKITERFYWKRKVETYPGYEMTPTSQWRYALALDNNNVKELSVKKLSSTSDYPWDQPTLAVDVPAYRVDNWYRGWDPITASLPKKVETKGKEKTIELVPYANCYLRMTIFPKK